MPTIFTHAVSALAIGSVVLPPKTGPRAWTLGVLCAMVPDLDVVGFALGVSYSDMLGHRGLTHSLIFALTLSLLLAAVAFRGSKWDGARLRIGLFLFLATASHGILDAFTNGGMGIAFFAPFSADRYFFPVTPIEVSPIGRGFLSERGLRVIASEAVWVWVPSLVVVAIALAVRHGRSRAIG
jgi:inner membrane protein